MTRKCINTDGAVAVGPYSRAVEAGDLLFLSGQTPIDPQTQKLSEGNIVVKNATFDDYISQGERWRKYIDYK
ncbi:RidA family protein, partial [Priestia megaterium]